jgi:glycerol-3-phosphate dehydrogenase
MVGWEKTEGKTGSFSFRTRRDNLAQLQDGVYDLAVVGGGITGAGIARDAAMRGMRVALIEQADFASGTSSRSSKLIHGGLRYLKQLEIGLVKESLAERETLLHIAPHLVQPLAFLIPNYAGLIERLELRIGLHGYDLLMGASSLGRHRQLSTEDVLQQVPMLRNNHLTGGFLYYDCLVDDGRLTLATIQSAHQYGAKVANYARAIGLDGANDRHYRVTFEEVQTRAVGEIRARVVVAAVGPWLDRFLQMRDHSERLLRPTKGVHLVFPARRLRVDKAVVLPTEDDRIVFVVPRGEFVYAGTTDTDYVGSFDAVPVEAHDVRYLLNVLNDVFPKLRLQDTDIVSSWAGLRPLLRGGGPPSKVSRDYHIAFFEDGLTCIAGGKLTTYRAMAEDLVDRVLQHFAERMQARFPSSRTRQTPLSGGEMGDFNAYLQAQSRGLTGAWGFTPSTAEGLLHTYGSRHMDLLAWGCREPSLLKPLGPSCPVIKAQVVHAVEEEMALTLEDFMARRTGLMHFSAEHGMDVVEEVARLMGGRLKWSRARRRDEIRLYERCVAEMLAFR